MRLEHACLLPVSSAGATSDFDRLSPTTRRGPAEHITGTAMRHMHGQAPVEASQPNLNLSASAACRHERWTVVLVLMELSPGLPNTLSRAARDRAPPRALRAKSGSALVTVLLTVSPHPCPSRSVRRSRYRPLILRRHTFLDIPGWLREHVLTGGSVRPGARCVCRCK